MSQSYDNFIKLAISRLSPKLTDFSVLKKELCRELRFTLPTNADLRECYEKLLRDQKISRSLELEKLLLSRKIRTQSGVAVVAVLTKAYPCPGRCLYCPTEKALPKSYLSNEPAVMRAIKAKFNPYRQVQNRLRSLELNGHKTDKIEMIVMGGTFSALPGRYQKWFLAQCFQACNEYGKNRKTPQTASVRQSLAQKLLVEQRKNEKAQHRIIGLTLETRPDFITEAEILNFRNLGATRVELGVQSLWNDVLKKNRRGHDVEETLRATRLLKDAGFKLGYHLMPGLPGSSPEKDLLMFQKLFSEPAFQPDLLKIYPTVVVRTSPLYKLWKEKKYRPLTDGQFEKMILKIKKDFIPPYARISRLVRDVPATSIVAGPKISNLRQLIAPRSTCRCIRCREVRADYKINESLFLDRIDYPASFGQEIFLQFVSSQKKKLFALLRLRIPSQARSPFPALRRAALIREVHTYGQLVPLKKRDSASPQHFGLGKKLLEAAEKIARQEFGVKKMAVIAGVGVREYYRKLGYRQKNSYMVKSI